MKRRRNSNDNTNAATHRAAESLRRMELRGLLRELERQAAQAATQAEQLHFYRRIMAVRAALAK